jgi:hypothetical protein
MLQIASWTARCLSWAANLVRVIAFVGVFPGIWVYSCGAQPAEPAKKTIVVQWDEVLLDAVRHAPLGPPMVARALAVAHTCMYDA